MMQEALETVKAAARFNHEHRARYLEIMVDAIMDVNKRLGPEAAYYFTLALNAGLSELALAIAYPDGLHKDYSPCQT